MDPLIHLIAGSTGAGKTTYAEALAARLGGVCFSIDAWMALLFWPDAAQPIDPAWALARVERCNAQIRTTAAAVAARGVPCVLDLGFTTAAQRRTFADWARAADLRLRLHVIDVDAEERWRRVGVRNTAEDGSQQLPFQVTRDMFDFIESIWEPPGAAEMAALNGLRID